MQKKRIPAAVLAAVLAVGAGAALAAPGTESDPFVTLSYLTNTYYAEVDQAIFQRVQSDTAQTAQDTLDKLEGLATGYRAMASCQQYASTFIQLTLLQGDRLVLPAGSSLLLESGTGNWSFTSGVLVDVTAGSEVTGGTPLAGHRYVAAEGTVCSLTAAGTVVLSVQGYYDLEATGQVQIPFTDVDSTDWFYPSVCYVYKTGLFQGVSPTLFSPATSMTRAMLATALSRLAGIEETAPDAGFTDVPAGSWYANAVNWSARAGIVEGIGNNLFDPDSDVTREQMVTMLYRYAREYLGMNVSVTGDLSPFSDRADLSAWAEQAVSWAVGAGIMNGDNGRLLPKGTATRAEVAALYQRFSALLP